MILDDINNLPVLPKRFGDVRQIAYVVKDIDAAIAHWQTLGIGAFMVSRNISPMKNTYFRGNKAGAAPVNMAFGYSGNMQIELIEPLHDHASLYTEAINGPNKGVHHYAICVDNFAAEYHYALDNGFHAVVDSGIDGLARMSYVENLETGLIIEMIEWNDLTRPYFDAIHTLWQAANEKGENSEFDLLKLAPTGAVIKALGGFISKKLTGRITPTMRPKQ